MVRGRANTCSSDAWSYTELAVGCDSAAETRARKV